jgi:hypothetical protein
MATTVHPDVSRREKKQMGATVLASIQLQSTAEELQTVFEKVLCERGFANRRTFLLS